MRYRYNCIVGFAVSNGRILKANLSWSPTRAKFCQLIARLSVVLPQLNRTKLKLEYVKSGFRRKKNWNFFASLAFKFFRVQLKFAF